MPGAPRLVGHSDGDALLHAITDPLLGAGGQGDIGQHYPPAEPSLEGIDSRELLRRAARLIAAQRYRVSNVDATVLAERPRIGPSLPAMRESIARTLGIETGRVNVKATTNEGLGDIGRGEAIAAMAVAVLEEDVA